MKGEQPHCGFPEKTYAANAERLARAGHRVVVVEQVETPAQLAARRAAGAKDQVVAREKVGVLTRGTLVDAAMTEASPDAAYVVALVEMTGSDERDGGDEDEDEDSDGPWIGACAVDCAAGRFLVGAWRDDAALTGARATLAALRPVEIVAPPTGLGSACVAAVRDVARTPSGAGGAATTAARDDTAAGALELFRRAGTSLGTTRQVPRRLPNGEDPRRLPNARRPVSRRPAPSLPSWRRWRRSRTARVIATPRRARSAR